MSWKVLLLVVLAVSLAVEWQGLRKGKQKKELLVYLTVWTCSLLWVIADMMELPGIRPLDWIKVVMYPINRLLP